MSIKDRQTKILLALLLMSDDTYRFLNFNESVNSIFDLSLNRKTITMFKRLEKSGLIESNPNKTNEEYSYKLTDSGFRDLSLNFPVFRFTNSQWDNTWRILSYQIPEKKRELRDKLRRQVSGWGLGPWHRSFWLTPHPIIESLKDLVSKKEEEQYIQLFESKHVFGDQENLIETVWNKSGLELKYRNLFKKWHEFLSKDQDKILKLKDVINSYVSILKIDPGLPKTLLGNTWIGYEATTLFREIRNILLKS